MGKFVFIHQKDKIENWDSALKKIKYCLPEIGKKAYFHSNGQSLLWVNNSGGIDIDGFQLTTGRLNKNDGYFSCQLLNDEESITLSSDATASRTVWYLVHQERLIISSSQRTIINLIGDFTFNETAASWMLSTGCTGFGQAWDQRIKHLSPQTTVTFSKKTLVLSIKKRELLTTYKNSLNENFKAVFSDFRNDNNLGITLSGGYDSRACAYFLKQGGANILAYSWGIPHSIDQEGTDAQVAKKTAEKLEIPFHFKALQDNHLSSKEILDTFITHSEGRIDHINAFTDGLKIWKQFAQDGVDAIVRADEAFGWLQISTEKDTRISLDANMAEDYQNLQKAFELSRLKRPSIPQKAHRLPEESLATWRDRLYREYRIPFILSSLHELMLPFVEILNPLLHDHFIQWTLQLPDEERTNKAKYKKYVESLYPDIPVATIPSIPETNDALASDGFFKEFKRVIDTEKGHQILGDQLVGYLLSKFQTGEQVGQLENKTIRKIKNLMPFWLKKMLRNSVQPYQLNHNKLVFRAYIIVSVHELFTKDLQDFE